MGIFQGKLILERANNLLKETFFFLKFVKNSTLHFQKSMILLSQNISKFKRSFEK